MAAVVAAVAAYFASLHPSSGKYPGGVSNYKSRATFKVREMVDIRPFIKDIPEGVLKYCPQGLREHHLEHIWIPFCNKEFLDMLLRYKDGKATEEELVLLVE